MIEHLIMTIGSYLLWCRNVLDDRRPDREIIYKLLSDLSEPDARVEWVDEDGEPLSLTMLFVDELKDRDLRELATEFARALQYENN